MDLDYLTTDYLIEFLSLFPKGTKVNIYFGKDNSCRKLMLGNLKPDEVTITLANLMDDLTLQQG